jgi:hypothetical protein
LPVLPGCAGHDEEAAPDPNAPPVTLLYSPNGEPLNGGPLGRPTCNEALSRWFERLAGSADGVITRAVFLADARTQFRRMDIDGNGYLVPEELERFRLPYRQPLPAARHHQDAAETTDNEGSPSHHRHHAPGDAGAGEITSDATPVARTPRARNAAQPDPVMSADTGLDFKVTLDAFLIQSAVTFARLDAGHGGLTRAGVLGLCQPAKS